MKRIEEEMRRTAAGVAAAFGATAKIKFPDIFASLVNNPVETAVIADVAADLVGEANVDRNRSLITAAEDFAYMLEARPGAFSCTSMAAPCEKVSLIAERIIFRGRVGASDRRCSAPFRKNTSILIL